MTEPATEQLPLIPEAPLVLSELQHVPLDRLPPDADLLSPPPEHALVESVRRWGVLQPVLVRAVGGALDMSNPATLVSGRRRIKALRLLLAEAQAEVHKISAAHPNEILTDELHPGYRAAYERLKQRQRIPVRVISDPEGVLGDGRTEALLVASNAVRADNPLADFKALAVLLDRLTREGHSERACLTQVAQITGLAPGTVKQRLRLLELSAELQDDFLAGRLGYTVALHASRLGTEGQAVFAEMLDNGEPATLELVKQAKRDSVRAHQADLFDGLPSNPRAEESAQAETLLARASRIAETLRATRLPVCVEAAAVIAEFIAAEEDHRIDAENRSLK